MDHYTFKRFYKKGIEKISRFVRAYVYLVLTSQVQARSSNSAPAVDAQQVFKGIFKALINEHYSIGIDIEVLGTGIYMFPSNLNLKIERTKGYNNKILVSKTDMKIGSNRDINRDHKKTDSTGCA